MNFHWKDIKVLFEVKSVWVDKGQGRWVLRRRFHPVTRFILILSALVLAITWSVDRFGTTEPETPATVKPLVKPIDVPLDKPLAEQKEPPAKLGDPGPDTEPLDEVAPLFQPPRKDNYWIKIKKSQYKLSLYKGSELLRDYRVAVGRNPGNKQRQGDNRTPVGRFRVQTIENSEKWKHDFGDGQGQISGAYGPWFIRLATGWKGIGIHGTHDPDSRGNMATEGCIRMSNEEVNELRKYVQKNTRVEIEE